MLEEGCLEVHLQADLTLSKILRHGNKKVFIFSFFHSFIFAKFCNFAPAMGNIKIRRGDFDTKLELEHASVVAGFPSPADDYRHEKLDFNRDYIRHPEASFYGDVDGDSMKDAGIYDGDRVIIDRAVEAHNGSIVVAWWNGDFTMKYLDLTHKKDGYIELRPANPDFPVFKVEAGDDFEVWGVVVHLIRTFERY